jgi:DNA-binding CsgD family transcriptional regulator
MKHQTDLFRRNWIAINWSTSNLRTTINLREVLEGTNMDIPVEFIKYWDSLKCPFGIKDTKSRFVYANPVYKVMQNLDVDFDISGFFDGELPTHTVAFEKEFQLHDRLVIENNKMKSSLEIHPFGKAKKMEAWIFHKQSFFIDGIIVGVMFWADPALHLNSNMFTSVFSPSIPTAIVLAPPSDLLTAKEWEILHLMLSQKTSKTIALVLALHTGTVRKHVNSIQKKLLVHSTEDLIELCLLNNWDRYIPAKYVIRHKLISF